MSDQIEDGFRVEIYCNDLSHADDEWLVDVFEFDDGGWHMLDRDGLAYYGYFDSDDGENPLQGVKSSKQFLYDDHYFHVGDHPPDRVHPGNYTRTRYKLRCRKCGGKGSFARHPEPVHAALSQLALNDPLAQNGVSRITLAQLRRVCC